MRASVDVSFVVLPFCGFSVGSRRRSEREWAVLSGMAFSNCKGKLFRFADEDLVSGTEAFAGIMHGSWQLDVLETA